MVHLSQQQEQVPLALQSWADVADITFIAKFSPNEPTNLNCSNFNCEKDQALAYLPFSGAQVWQYWFNVQNHSENLYPMNGNYGRHTLVHEIGYALGLSYPGKYNAGEGVRLNYNRHASYKEDSRQYSMMSYWPESTTGAYFQGLYSSSPLLDDIKAI
ncbi:MAG TPA: hypothetical protein ACHBX0_12770 [Arsenophonus sp.]